MWPKNIAYVEKYELISHFSDSERKQVLEMKTELNHLRLELKSPYEFLMNIHCNNKTPDGKVSYDSLTNYGHFHIKGGIAFLGSCQYIHIIRICMTSF